MERVQSMFGSNVFSTPAGELVDKATSLSLSTEDWGLNIQVCDAINSYGDGAKDAVKAIKKRLSGNKNFLQISLTLSLLETCVKNCGTRLHVLVTTKDFCCDTMLKLIHAKYNPPVVLQQRVLGMIKQWAETFGSNPAQNGAKQVYDELREKGYDFPETEPLEISSKNNEKLAKEQHRAHHTVQTRPRHSDQGGHASSSRQSQVVNPNSEQLAKLRKDLVVVNGNAKVFSEMLTELNPIHCDSSDYELLTELNRTCRAMQQRIMELLEQIASEEMTVELLKVNDDLNNIFLRYERFEKFRANKDAVNPPSDVTTSIHPEGAHAAPMGMVEPPPSYSDTVQPTPEVNDLIDFGSEEPTISKPQPVGEPSNIPSLSKQLGDINLNNRSATSAAPASYPLLSEQLSMFDKPPEEVEQLGASEREIEQWLSTDGDSLGLKQPAEPVALQGTNVTDEFSAFLSERATAADKLPNVNTSSSS